MFPFLFPWVIADPPDPALIFANNPHPINIDRSWGRTYFVQNIVSRRLCQVLPRLKRLLLFVNYFKFWDFSFVPVQIFRLDYLWQYRQFPSLVVLWRSRDHSSALSATSESFSRLFLQNVFSYAIRSSYRFLCPPAITMSCLFCKVRAILLLPWWC